MSALKSILLHLDASPSSATRLDMARKLAQRHEACVNGLFAVTSNFVAMPFAAVESAGAGAMVLKLDAERRDRALAQFKRVAQQGDGPAVTWAELGTEPPIWGFTQQAFYSDLLVLGQHEPDGAAERDVPADFVESVLMGSGKPALVVPYACDVKTVGQNILVAWRATRESARALGAALPLLKTADHVHVVAWSEEQGVPQAASERQQVETYLASHGVKPTMHWYGERISNPGDHLLSLAADLGNDTLVMGCYGHTRARELILGGVTRTLLRSMTIPVLMAH